MMPREMRKLYPQTGGSKNRQGAAGDEVRSGPLSEPNPEDDANAKLTAVGCVLTSLSIAVICAVALPIVSWRDPETGQRLPRVVAICGPILIGAAFHGLASLILKLIGVPIWAKREQDESNRQED
jgi:hypothetical protein